MNPGRTPLLLLPALLLGCWGAQAEPEPAPVKADCLDPLVPRFAQEPGLASELRDRIATRAAELPGSLEAVVAPDPSRAEHLRIVLQRNVCANLEAKVAAPGPDGSVLPLSADDLRRTVVDYEAFKIDAYVRSGVFPKRYFGYFDGTWDSADRELRLAEVVRASTEVIRGWLTERGHPWPVTDMELAITWVSEGGALMLRTRPMEGIHPVLDIGLDDIASGVKELPELTRRLDERLGTDVAGLLVWETTAAGRERARLTRAMTFDESIVGTALMWVWEKEIAQRKLVEAGRPPLQDRPLDEQFVLTSLVYNSGLIHDAGREKQILAFDTGVRVVEISDRNAHRRDRLPVPPPPLALQELSDGSGYRDQPTSWLAVYHVLQRWGGYEAMRRFTDVFDEQGGFRVGAGGASKR